MIKDFTKLVLKVKPALFLEGLKALILLRTNPSA